MEKRVQPIAMLLKSLRDRQEEEFANELEATIKLQCEIWAKDIENLVGWAPLHVERCCKDLKGEQ